MPRNFFGGTVCKGAKTQRAGLENFLRRGIRRLVAARPLMERHKDPLPHRIRFRNRRFWQDIVHGPRHGSDLRRDGGRRLRAPRPGGGDGAESGVGVRLARLRRCIKFRPLRPKQNQGREDKNGDDAQRAEESFDFH